MRALDAVERVIADFAARVARRRERPASSCGACERWQRCGLPPSKNCIVMVAQLARNPGRPVKRSILSQGGLS
jgi:hypothetical protein